MFLKVQQCFADKQLCRLLGFEGSYLPLCQSGRYDTSKPKRQRVAKIHGTLGGVTLFLLCLNSPVRVLCVIGNH